MIIELIVRPLISTSRMPGNSAAGTVVRIFAEGGELEEIRVSVTGAKGRTGDE